MMKYRIEIVLGNAAMSTNADVADLLRKLAERLDVAGEEAPEAGHDRWLRDTNGNQVGLATVEE